MDQGYGYGRGGRGRGTRDERERGSGGRGRARGRAAGAGGGNGGGAGGGRGRGNPNFQYQPHPHQQQQRPQSYQQQHFRQPSPGNQWVSRPNPGSNWRPAVPAQVEPSAGGSASASQRPVSSGSYAAMLQSSSSQTGADPSGSAVVAKMQSLKISGQTSQPSPGSGILPIKRPDSGGLAKIRTVNILVNHFPVSFNPETVIRHYDIDVKPEVAAAKGRAVKISKANLCLIMEKLFSDHPSFQQEMIGYDGEKNIFSATPLPTGQFKVELSGEVDMRCRSYIFTVNLVNELRLRRLKDYLTGDLLQIPRDVLQGMDVVMKENPRRHMVSIGRSFHPKDPHCDLGSGLAASEGFQQGLKPTSQGLALCLDYSVLAVRKRIPVLDFLNENIRGFSFNSFHNRMRKKEIESALKGLKVTVVHRVTKQKYLVTGLTEKRACDITFTKEDPDGQVPPISVRLVDYFREKYRVNIQHTDMPCLNLGKGGRANYVPIELCVLVEGQRYPKENLDRNCARLLKNMSLAPPQERKNKICGMLQSEGGPCGGGICNNFEMDVRMNMTKVEGRVIRPPQLRLRALNGNVNAFPVQGEKCEWNLVDKSVVEGKSLERWAVLDFTLNERDRLDDRKFIPKLIARCNKLGLHVTPPLLIERTEMRTLYSVDSLTQLMEQVNYEACRGQGNLQLLLCVMARKDSAYKYIKWISEAKMGVITQCCLSPPANEARDQYLANLGMKINAKLGGSNVELVNQLPLFEDGSHVILIGADVNHPRAMDASSPSIAAVVASMNQAANKYSPRVRFQQHRSEKIINFGEICLELIESYERFNGVKPGKILIFRDGVSEGQFDMVLNEELLDLKKVLQGQDYCPTITVIVARKRHHTRLFPETPRDGSFKGNVPPGTVVDRTIVHPFEFDFYLCSHYGSIGTSKPTHYHVLWDEHGFSSDKLQELIYNLCYTFARCCKPVSLVPPVYYADLLAYRGRLHFDAVTEKQSSGSSSSWGGTSSSASGASMDESIFKLHSDLENTMFFV